MHLIVKNAMDTAAEALKLHERNKGKIQVKSKVPLKTKKDLTLAYTPGVAEPCREIVKNSENIYKYTSKGNMVAVITDGSAVLGLGDIGPEAALPVMEGKAILFKEFADIDAIPLCLATKDVDEIVAIIKAISPSFGGINLEDISSPRCFEIENRLKKELDIPVFHDDQHGTAVAVYAGLINALKLTGKNLSQVSITISGAGAAGIVITKFLLSAGAKDIVVCDSKGALTKDRVDLHKFKKEIADITNPEHKSGKLADVIKKSDVFIGVSAPNIVSKEMVRSMNKDPIIFAMSNPVPEIMPKEAIRAGAKIVATGRSDFKNQINNVIGFPAIFRGALDVRASEINEEMKFAAAYAIAGIVGKDLDTDYIIPDTFDKRIKPIVSKAVSEAAVRTKVSRI